MGKNLDKLYSAISTEFDIGDSASFQSKMDSPDKRKAFYDKVKGAGYDLGEYDQYESRLSADVAPEPVAPPPVGSANDPNNHSARIKELMDYASSFDTSGTPEAISRVKAEANREIEKLHSKYGTGSVPQWVRSQLSGGATKRQSKFGAATDMLNSVFDPMERS